MADLSHWFAQACEYHDREGTFKVIYFQYRQELMAVVQGLLRNEDSWSDDLFVSNMGSNAYKKQVAMPSRPDTGSWEPTEPHSPVRAPHPGPVPVGHTDLQRIFNNELFKDLPVPAPHSAPVPGDTDHWQRILSKKLSDDLPVPAPHPAPVPGDTDHWQEWQRILSKKLSDDLPGSSAGPQNDIPKYQDVLDHEVGKKAPPLHSISTNSSKNYDLVQEAKKKDEIKYQESIKQGALHHVKTFVKKLFGKDPQVHPLEDYKTQDQYLDEVGSSLPKEYIKHLKDSDDDPYRTAKAPGYCKYALLFGITTEFNPSGVWVIEELFNDLQESDF